MPTDLARPPLVDRLLVYAPAAETTARYRLLYGGAGSGKSVFVAQDYIGRLQRDGRRRLLCMRKTGRSCRHSTFSLFQRILRAMGRLSACEVNRTEMRITFPNGADIIHAGIKDDADRDKLKSIDGVTDIWVEEATELDFPASESEEDDLAQIDLRLRGVPAGITPQLTLTFNPTAEARRLFEYVGVPASDLPTRSHRHYQGGQVYVQHTTYEDNPWVGTDYVQVFRRLGGTMQTVYERGELASVDAPDQLIRYAWVKAAFERDPADAWTDGRQRLGVDVARYGDDWTCKGVGEGYALEYVERTRGQDTTTTGRRVVTLAHERSVPAELVAVDTVGLGAGAADTAVDLGLEVTEFKAGGAPARVDLPAGDARPALPADIEFNNLRSQAWYFYREMLRAGLIAYAPDLPGEVKRTLQEDLLAPRYRIGRERRLEVEPKQGTSKNWSIKHRLGRSPDVGDMDVMRVFGEFARQEQPTAFVVFGHAT